MNVKKQDPMDIEETTCAKYEWHTYEMQTIKSPTMNSKGCKNNFPPLKRIEQLLEKNILRKKKLYIEYHYSLFHFMQNLTLCNPCTDAYKHFQT